MVLRRWIGGEKFEEGYRGERLEERDCRRGIGRDGLEKKDWRRLIGGD